MPTLPQTPPVVRRRAFYQALAYRVVDAYGVQAEPGDLEEALKTACARANARYNSELVRKALDAALYVRTRRSA